MDRFDREKLSSTDPVVRSALLMAFSEAARDANHLDLARWSIDKSLAAAPTAAAEVDLALLAIRAHDVPAARAALDQALRLEPNQMQARAMLAALPAQ
jgi:Tfp pilus assembly protein PilF